MTQDSPSEGFNDPIRPLREVTIWRVHQRLQELWGRAAEYPCANDCGKRAKDWAYDGFDPSQLLGYVGNSKTQRWYSLYPEFYMPLCRGCHGTRDNALARQELEEYRQWKVKTRLTLADIDLDKVAQLIVD